MKIYQQTEITTDGWLALCSERCLFYKQKMDLDRYYGYQRQNVRVVICCAAAATGPYNGAGQGSRMGPLLRN